MDKTTITAQLISDYNKRVKLLNIVNEFQKHDFFFTEALHPGEKKEYENDLKFLSELICISTDD